MCNARMTNPKMRKNNLVSAVFSIDWIPFTGVRFPISGPAPLYPHAPYIQNWDKITFTKEQF